MYPSPNIINIIKSKRIKLARTVACRKDEKLLSENHEGRTCLDVATETEDKLLFKYKYGLD
jgi:hypothetical protein